MLNCKPERKPQVLPKNFGVISHLPQPLNKLNNCYTSKSLHLSNFESSKITSVLIQFASYNKTINDIEGELQFDGKQCSETVKNSLLEDNGFLEFKIKENCQLSSAGEVSLKICTEHAGAIALWLKKFDPSDSESKQGLFLCHDTNCKNKQFVSAQFDFESRKEQQNFIEAYAKFWNLNKGDLIVLIGLFLSLVVAASLILSRYPLRALVVFFFAFGGLQSVLTPPFQAPDEPDHVLSIAAMKYNSTLNRELLNLAGRGYFDQIVFNPESKLSNAERKGNMEVWPTFVQKSNIKKRGVLPYWVFRSANSIFGNSANNYLISLRLLCLIIVTFGYGVFLRILDRCVGEKDRKLTLASSFLTLPILLFFSISVSNYPILLATYFVHAGLLLEFVSSKSNHPRFWFLTVAMCLVSALMGRIGILISGFWLSVLFFTVLRSAFPKVKINRRILKTHHVVIPCMIIVILNFLTNFQYQTDLNIEGNSSVQGYQYVFGVMSTWAINFFGFGHSFYLHRSFFSGFGWLDFNLSEYASRTYFMYIQVGILFFFQFGKSENYKKWSVAISLMCYLGLLAFGCYTIGYNLHGRYLLGFYLLACVCAFLGISALFRLNLMLSRLLPFAIVLINFVHLYIVIARYA